jgi:abortive infection bacteriophage resistance protein
MLKRGGFSLFAGWCEMNYAKLPLTYEQQADLLLARGMVADRGRLIDRLRSVNYYRLTIAHMGIPEDWRGRDLWR